VIQCFGDNATVDFDIPVVFGPIVYLLHENA
jgi:hypothetical protein